MTPVVRTGDLGAALADWRDHLGFEVLQEIPGVLAILQLGQAQLQLWQRAAWPQGRCEIARGELPSGLFDLHARIARRARDRLDGPPRLHPWGSWEVSVCDVHGNRVTFVEWAVQAAGKGPAQPRQEPHDGSQRAP